jgi:hypothetical protein
LKVLLHNAATQGCQGAVAAIAGASDHAIAKLVLAFGADPVARWMYDDSHQYLLHIPRMSIG